MLVYVKILRKYLNCAGQEPYKDASCQDPVVHWALPLCATKKNEMSARTPLVLHVMWLLGV